MKKIFLNYFKIAYKLLSLNLPWMNLLARYCLTKKTIIFNSNLNFTKKNFIYIDISFPRFDRDAGARTIWETLSFIKNNGYNIIIVLIKTGDEDSIYLPKYKALTNNIIGFDEFSSHIGRIRSNNISFVLLKGPDVFSLTTDLLRKLGNITKIYYYGSDIYHNRFSFNNSDSSNFVRFHKYLACIYYSRLEKKIWSKNYILLYPSQKEVDYVLCYSPSVRRLPIRLVETRFFDNIHKYSNHLDFSNSPFTLFVGGTGHLPNVTGVIWFVNNVLPFLRKDRNVSKFKLSLVGEGWENVTEIKKVKEINIVGKISDIKLIDLYKNSTCVVAPLIEGAGVKGKIIEAIMFGVPVVTTKTGAEGINFKMLSISDDPHEFANMLIDIYRGCVDIRAYRAECKNFLKLNYSEHEFRLAFSELFGPSDADLRPFI